jgi:hypothetical protein
MKPEKYLNLFKKYVNGKVNIHGVYLIPIQINDNYEIYYSLDNSDDKSYSKASLIGWLHEIREKFNEIIGIDFIENLNYLDIENLYLNKDLINKLSNYLKTVKVLHLNDSYEIHVEHLYFTVGVRHENEFVVTNYVRPIKSFINTENNKKRVIDLVYALERYFNYQKMSRFDETEISYPQFDDIIDESALVDNDWMVQYVITEFDLNS